MPDTTISVTATEQKCLEYAAADVQDWADNAVTNRARIAKDEIIGLLVAHCNTNGVTIEQAKTRKSHKLLILKL